MKSISKDTEVKIIKRAATTLMTNTIFEFPNSAVIKTWQHDNWIG
jgi:hypothetical protein